MGRQRCRAIARGLLNCFLRWSMTLVRFNPCLAGAALMEVGCADGKIVAEAEPYALGVDDGTFLMDSFDWFSCFTNIFVSASVPSSWFRYARVCRVTCVPIRHRKGLAGNRASVRGEWGSSCGPIGMDGWEKNPR